MQSLPAHKIGASMREARVDEGELKVLERDLLDLVLWKWRKVVRAFLG